MTRAKRLTTVIINPFNTYFSEITEASGADPDESADNEPPRQDLHCLSIVFTFENITLFEEWVILKI